MLAIVRSIERCSPLGHVASVTKFEQLAAVCAVAGLTATISSTLRDVYAQRPEFGRERRHRVVPEVHLRWSRLNRFGLRAERGVHSAFL